MMGIAAGIATTGKVVFASTFAIFATGRAFEIIRNSIAYSNLNVKIVATHAGITIGEDGGSHQAIEDISLMRSIPNMKVIVPADAIETEKVINKIIDYEGPFYIRLGRAKIPIIFNSSYNFEIGKNKVLKKGNDITIIACGIMVEKALQCYKFFKKKGINLEIINASSIKPFDKETLINSAKKTKCVISLEEHSIIGGLGSVVSETLSENFPVLVKRIGVNDIFGESGNPDKLIKKYKLDTNSIINYINDILNIKNKNGGSSEKSNC